MISQPEASVILGASEDGAPEAEDMGVRAVRHWRCAEART